MGFTCGRGKGTKCHKDGGTFWKGDFLSMGQTLMLPLLSLSKSRARTQMRRLDGRHCLDLG